MKLKVNYCYDEDVILDLFCTWENYEKTNTNLSYTQWMHEVRKYNAIIVTNDNRETVCITLYKPRGYKMELHTYFLIKPRRELLRAHDETLQKILSLGYSKWFTYCPHESSMRRYLKRKYNIDFMPNGYGEAIIGDNYVK